MSKRAVALLMFGCLLSAGAGGIAVRQIGPLVAPPLQPPVQAPTATVGPTATFTLSPSQIVPTWTPTHHHADADCDLYADRYAHGNSNAATYCNTTATTYRYAAH